MKPRGWIWDTEPESLLDAALVDALHSTQGAEKRWEARRKAGATDEQLAEYIAAEFGIMGGYAGPEMWWTAKGSRFWVSQGSHNAVEEKPTLTGQKLIDAVRRVMRIPNVGEQQGVLL